MSARDGLRDHFTTSVLTTDGRLDRITSWEITTADASRALRERAKRDGLLFVVSTMNNLSNGRTLKIIGLRPSEVAKI